MIRKTVSVTLLLACASGMALAQPGPRGAPPPEAIAACTGVSLEQACRFESPRGELTGTCREVRDGSVACVPDDAPGHGRRSTGTRPGGADAPRSGMGGGRGGPPPGAFTACENLNEGDVCSVETPRGTLSGTCRTPGHESLQGASLVCAPAGGPPPR